MTTARIALFALLVADYDAAIRFFTQALRFTLLEDTDQGGGKRWVVVAPPGGQGGALLLARAVTEARRHELYGTVAVFDDLCCNRWDLIGPHQPG